MFSNFEIERIMNSLKHPERHGGLLRGPRPVRRLCRCDEAERRFIAHIPGVEPWAARRRFVSSTCRPRYDIANADTFK